MYRVNYICYNTLVRIMYINKLGHEQHKFSPKNANLFDYAGRLEASSVN